MIYIVTYRTEVEVIFFVCMYKRRKINRIKKKKELYIRKKTIVLVEREDLFFYRMNQKKYTVTPP
jgi:hypothetical protein